MTSLKYEDGTQVSETEYWTTKYNIKIRNEFDRLVSLGIFVTLGLLLTITIFGSTITFGDLYGYNTIEFLEANKQFAEAFSPIFDFFAILGIILFCLGEYRHDTDLSNLKQGYIFSSIKSIGDGIPAKCLFKRKIGRK